MRTRGTWVALFFLLGSLVFAAALNHAFRDIFLWLQIENTAVLGDNFRLSLLLALSIALVFGVFFGFFYKKSRTYIEQCVAEFNKVAWPAWKETKVATFTVVMVSLIASVILGFLDTIFSTLVNHNLFLW
jgi:preprotein translocase SecE subunit